MAFVPIQYWKEAYETLKNERPSSPKVEDFIKYFEKTWVDGDYPIKLWNHNENSGPRTNNHLEGDNRKTNNEMPSVNLNIFQYIDFNKILEAEVFINYHRRENSCKFHSKRRPIDIQRDERIRNLKSNLANSLGSSQFVNQEMNLINQFVRSIAHLYHYERKVNEEGDEIIDTPQIQIPPYSGIVRLQNPDSYQNKTVPLDELKNLKKVFTSRSRFGTNLSALDLESLGPGQWLNDNILNYYLNLLILSLNKSCYLFDSFFWVNLNSPAPSVDSWFVDLNIFIYRFHLIPIHHSENHWMLVCVDTYERKMILFDSFHGSHPLILIKLKHFYRRQYFRYFGIELTTAWVFDHAKSIPLQKNGHDCGVFVCKFAELFLRESINYNFLSRDCEYFRKSILFSLLIDELY